MRLFFGSFRTVVPISKNASWLVKHTIFCRSLGLNTVTAYQRAKVSALKIVNLGMGSNPASATNHQHPKAEVTSVQVDLEPPILRSPSNIQVPPQTRI